MSQKGFEGARSVNQKKYDDLRVNIERLRISYGLVLSNYGSNDHLMQIRLRSREVIYVSLSFDEEQSVHGNLQ